MTVWIGYLLFRSPVTLVLSSCRNWLRVALKLQPVTKEMVRVLPDRSVPQWVS